MTNNDIIKIYVEKSDLDILLISLNNYKKMLELLKKSNSDKVSSKELNKRMEDVTMLIGTFDFQRFLSRKDRTKHNV